jgi:5'(3')-deoxyribonucleotidase
MEQTIIGVDVDDVVLELVSAWLRQYNFDHDDFLTESDIKTWDIASYTKIGDRMYDYLKNPRLYSIIHPVTGSFSGIKKLREMGYRVVFITSSTVEQSGVKYNLLYNTGFVSRREDYFEATDKSLIKTHYLIDDRVENVVNAHGIGVIYTREWNKSLVGYPRVSNWNEIVDFFMKQESAQEIISV